MRVVYIQRHRAHLYSVSVICRVFKQAIVRIEHLTRQQEKEFSRGSTIIQSEEQYKSINRIASSITTVVLWVN